MRVSLSRTPQARWGTRTGYDATKGLGFVPEFQPLTSWDDLERKRRGLA
jgi:hypothetical protein